jgi:hypothetical protein
LTIYIRHMDGPPSRDRLAVWTYVQHGEEIPCGGPSVTDAERAAAGRETLTGRWQAVLPGWWDQQLPAAPAWLLASP